MEYVRVVCAPSCNVAIVDRGASHRISLETRPELHRQLHPRGPLRARVYAAYAFREPVFYNERGFSWVFAFALQRLSFGQEPFVGVLWRELERMS
jgi:hypothetical protein